MEAQRRVELWRYIMEDSEPNTLLTELFWPKERNEQNICDCLKIFYWLAGR